MAEFEPLTEKDKSIYDIVKNLDIQYAEIIRPDKPFRVISASDKMKNFNGNRYFVCITYKDNPYYTIILNNEYNKAFNNINMNIFIILVSQGQGEPCKYICINGQKFDWTDETNGVIIHRNGRVVWFENYDNKEEKYRFVCGSGEIIDRQL